MRKWILGLAVACLAPAAFADDELNFAPAPDWVIPIEVPEIEPAASGTPTRLLLQEIQVQFADDGDSFFNRSVFRIQSPQGLAAGNVWLEWQPDTDEVTVHKLAIRRDGQEIDVLANQSFEILRREQNLQFAVLDGALTASIQPEGLRVGDTLELVSTLKLRDPVMQGRSEIFQSAMAPSVIDRQYIRLLWEPSQTVGWQTSEDLEAFTTRDRTGRTELIIDESNVEPKLGPYDAPLRYQLARTIEASEFSSWEEVSALFSPLYRDAATLNAGSPIWAEIERIRSTTEDPVERAGLALQLVQSQTRYVYRGMDLGNLNPATADETWSRRFGDCKAKTALLMSLLNALDIDAEPALASTVMGDGLDTRLPLVQLFDHILVKATIGGRTYWLDGTRTGDKHLAHLRTPPFSWALPVRATGGRLEELTQAPLETPVMETMIDYDLTGGMDVPPPVSAQITYRGDFRLAAQLSLENFNRPEQNRMMQEVWSSVISDVDVEEMSYEVDDDNGELHMRMTGTTELDWSRTGAWPAIELSHGSIGGDYDFERDVDFNEDAPYMVMHPTYTLLQQTIQLPDGGDGFSIQGEDVDLTIAGTHYIRELGIDDGVMTLLVSARTVAPEFPASEAETASAEFKRLSEDRAFLRSPRGASLAARAAERAGVARPASVGVVDGRSPEEMLEAINEGVSAAPDSPELLWIRSQLHLRMSNREAARADIDRAIALQPSDTFFLTRAGIREEDDFVGRRADITAAIALKPENLTYRLAAAENEQAAGALSAALRHIEYVIDKEPDNASAYVARAGVHARNGDTDLAIKDFAHVRSMDDLSAVELNSLCWEQAITKTTLEAALSDCDLSIEKQPDWAPSLDSRAMVKLQLGRLDDALADYNAALEQAPLMGASLYGRGVTRLRMGDQAGGEADLEAARDLSPGIDRVFEGYGVSP